METRYAVFFTDAEGKEHQVEIATNFGAGDAIQIATGVRPFSIHREAGITVAGVAGFRKVSAYKVSA